MRLEFLRLPPDERRLYIEQVAVRKNVLPVIVEKDFWVSWMLAVLFSSKFANAPVFKGGTSLSKVFGVIDRFSEDIDLSLSPDFLGLKPAGTSRNQANKWMQTAEAACAACVQNTIAPELENIVTEVLGEKSGRCLEFVVDASTNSPVLLFHYPTSQPTGFAYLKRSVKLEFGSLTDQRPADRHPVRPWMAEVLESAFSDWRCEVVALELERTFWEKATILHAEHHRPAGKPIPGRFSCHYADTAALARHPSATTAIANHELRDRVVAWKGTFFGSGWARYDLARPGTFRLLPTDERLPELRRDYEAMRDMYLSEPPGFDVVHAVLNDLEHCIPMSSYS
jgi:hypothetical protein